jgi:FMN phosphatase YigB (HAD superfamily)
MIKAVIFDFGQTLVDSADGFRKAEKEAQDRLFKDLSLTLKDKFLDNYRRIRQQFHELLDSLV